MPVTIGTLTSNVNVVDNEGMANDAMVERIVRLVMIRLRQERQFEDLAHREREIRDRMSQTEPF